MSRSIIDLKNLKIERLRILKRKKEDESRQKDLRIVERKIQAMMLAGISDFTSVSIGSLSSRPTKMPTPQYKEYMDSPDWEEKRQEAFYILGTSCELCLSEENLNIHHNNYDCLGNEVPMEDLAVLCRNCHRGFHRNTSKRDMKYGRYKPLIERAADFSDLDPKYFYDRDKFREYNKALKNWTTQTRTHNCSLCGGHDYHDKFLILEGPQRKILICDICNLKYSKTILKETIIKTMEAR